VDKANGVTTSAFLTALVWAVTQWWSVQAVIGLEMDCRPLVDWCGYRQRPARQLTKRKPRLLAGVPDTATGLRSQPSQRPALPLDLIADDTSDPSYRTDSGDFSNFRSPDQRKRTATLGKRPRDRELKHCKLVDRRPIARTVNEGDGKLQSNDIALQPNCRLLGRIRNDNHKNREIERRALGFSD
jgi:hypothetical protein